jgi:peptidyl-prolyl cis-trans isomerase SurA
MRKLIASFMVLVSFSASAQTLFHYGKDSVSAKEFLKAYKKNNTGALTEKGLQDYLDLYINSRLKIAEAKSRGYDTLPQLVADLESLRQQILPNYLTDKATVDKMVNEAFTRSQRDIHLAHIFIASHGSADTAEANKKLADVQAGLKKGTSFAELARQYSDDPSATENGGDLGFITVFILPYELENLAYSTPVGKTSAVYKSKAGYHIFKNLGERKAIGRLKAAQILLAFPPGATDTDKFQIKKQADSLYNRLLKGDDFGKLASQFSNDVVSAASNGQIPEFGAGQYDAVFENAVFSLPKDDAISRPFATSHGYHIVKRLAKTPVSTTKDAKTLAELRSKVEQSDRMNTSKAMLAKKILKEANFKKAGFNPAELWAYSDSVINFQKPKQAVHLTNSTPLFSLNNKTFTTSDWTNYAQTFRYKSDGSGIKPYPQIWDEFVEASAADYYQKHLEEFNEDFRQQIDEFKDGNLFFEIMQRQVWGPAQTDSTALEAYYQKHKDKYNWKQSADAVLFYATDAAAAKSFINELKKSPSRWRALVDNMSEKISADSSRFEVEQIPNPSKLPVQPGTITAPLTSKADNTVSFAYILKFYPQPAPRSFAEAKGLVITDYQAELEKNWVAELKKKYPVKVNQKVLEEVKHKEI